MCDQVAMLSLKSRSGAAGSSPAGRLLTFAVLLLFLWAALFPQVLTQ